MFEPFAAIATGTSSSITPAHSRPFVVPISTSIDEILPPAFVTDN
jgi:hypothetical protein